MEETLRRMREKRAGGDQGFTLIELLVVVVIIGILVAIAIPLYMNYKKGAENRSAQSDVRQAVTAIEQCYTDGANNYPTGTSAATSPAASQLVLTCGTAPTTGTATINISNGNTITYTAVAGGYTVTAKNTDANKTYTYNSTTGAFG